MHFLKLMPQTALLYIITMLTISSVFSSSSSFKDLLQGKGKKSGLNCCQICPYKFYVDLELAETSHKIKQKVRQNFHQWHKDLHDNGKVTSTLSFDAVVDSSGVPSFLETEIKAYSKASGIEANTSDFSTESKLKEAEFLGSFSPCCGFCHTQFYPNLPIGESSIGLLEMDSSIQSGVAEGKDETEPKKDKETKNIVAGAGAVAGGAVVGAKVFAGHATAGAAGFANLLFQNGLVHNAYAIYNNLPGDDVLVERPQNMEKGTCSQFFPPTSFYDVGYIPKATSVFTELYENLRTNLNTKRLRAETLAKWDTSRTTKSATESVKNVINHRYECCTACESSFKMASSLDSQLNPGRKLSRVGRKLNLRPEPVTWMDKVESNAARSYEAGSHYGQYAKPNAPRNPSNMRTYK